MLSPNQLAKRVTAGWSLNSAPKLTPTVLFLIFFFLPTQLGRHFWPDWAFVQGLRSDYLAPTVYFSDLLILFLVLYLGLRWLLLSRKFVVTAAQQTYLLLWLGLVIVAVLSLYGAANPQAGWWRLGKLVEFGLLGLIVSRELGNSASRRLILSGLLFGGLIQAVVAFGQFLLGHDLGLWVLGERTFSGETPGIAQAVVNGKLVLRAYGTFSHPNVLGFYMLVSSQLTFYLTIVSRSSKAKLFYSVLTVVFSLALLASLSRLGLILWLIAVPVMLLFYSKFTDSLNRKGLNLPLLAATTLTILFLLSPLTSWFTNLVEADSQSVTDRVLLAEKALSFWQGSPWSGIGLANFVPKLADLPALSFVREFQPAHNLYLLALAEVGIIGLVFLVGLIGVGGYRAYRARQWWLVVITALLIVAGLFDHYFWDIEQGGLIFWIIIGGLYSPMVARGVTPDQPPEPPS